MSNFRDLLARVKSEIQEVSPEEVHELLERRDPPAVLDVREDEEVQHGIVPGAAHLSRAHFESRAEDVLSDKDAPVVVYCAGGVRSAFAAKTLEDLGYTNVYSMAGGFSRWKALGFDYEMPRLLSEAQRDRYSRHLILPEVGEAGQGKLLDAKVLCIGAGGLGSPALLYLAAAGVGTLGIVDSDVVEANNLQRQVVHNTERVGALKADSASETLRKLNPDVDVRVHTVRMDESNARDIMSGYDLVVDGCDNFATRYVVNDTAVSLRIPVIHGSIFRFEGMTSTFVPQEGPCYRCLFPEAPPEEMAPTWSEAGVLGVLPGIVGCLQANEALKLIVGYGEPLVGRLLTFDAQTTRFAEVKVRRDPSCVSCGRPRGAVEDFPEAGTPAA